MGITTEVTLSAASSSKNRSGIPTFWSNGVLCGAANILRSDPVAYCYKNYGAEGQGCSVLQDLRGRRAAVLHPPALAAQQWWGSLICGWSTKHRCGVCLRFPIGIVPEREDVKTRIFELFDLLWQKLLLKCKWFINYSTAPHRAGELGCAVFYESSKTTSWNFTETEDPGKKVSTQAQI